MQKRTYHGFYSYEWKSHSKDHKPPRSNSGGFFRAHKQSSPQGVGTPSGLWPIRLNGVIMVARIVPIERLQEVVAYDPESGIFTWKVSRGRAVKGKPVASSNSDGYKKFSVDGCGLFAHRAAYALVHGAWPVMVDHINGDRSDNRISNLREASCVQNNRNSAKKSFGRSKFRGASFNHGYWNVLIRNQDGKQIYGGRFKRDVEAAYHYDLLSIQFHGEFGRRNFLPLA